jgi:hypothetical protein
MFICSSKLVCPGDAKPRQYRDPIKNGCGSEALVKFVPTFVKKSTLSQIFTPCCDIHDICYGTLGATQKRCDDAFKQCNTRACDVQYGSSYVKKQLCYGALNTMQVCTTPHQPAGT